MYNLKALTSGLLLFASLIVLIDPNQIIYGFTFLIFLTGVIFHAKQNVSYRNFVLVTIFIFFYIFDLLISQKVSFDGCIKNLILFFIILFGMEFSEKWFAGLLKFFFYLNICVSLINYIFPQIIPIGEVYQTELFLNRRTNTGIFFEMNYSAMFTIISAFYLFWNNKLKLIASLFFAFTLFTFRSSLFFLPLVFFGNSRIFNRTYFIIFVGCLSYIFLNYGIVLEQRYFIWSSFFYSYDFQIERFSEFQDKMMIIMKTSPWGDSGLNLHNGFFESFISRGFLSTLFVYGYIYYVLFLERSVFRQNLINTFLMCSIFMSLAIGGLNLLSIFFTLTIFNNRKEMENSSINSYLTLEEST